MPKILLYKENNWAQTVQEDHENCVVIFLVLCKTKEIDREQVCVRWVLKPSEKAGENMKTEIS